MPNQLIHWLNQHSILLGSLAAASAVLLLSSILATPWLVSRLPADYLLQRERPSLIHPLLHATLQMVRTIIGAFFIVMGLAMLILPGPGLVTLLVGVSIARFPGKRQLLQYIASRKTVYNSLNWMRRRYNKPMLLHPFHDDQ